MASPDTRVPISRVLVLEGDREVRSDYQLLLASSGSLDDSQSLLSQIDPGADSVESLEQRGPSYDVSLLADTEAALEAVRESVDAREPFALAFVDVDQIDSDDALQFLEQIRRLDPDMQIVGVMGQTPIDPNDLVERVPPADKVMLLCKPFHGGEIQSMATALTAKWRSERARAASLRIGGRAGNREPGDGSADLENLPCGLMVFDRHDRLVLANGQLSALFPELSEFLAPGTRYEEIQWQLAQRLLPEDTLYRVESWVRDRLEWHTAGGGVSEQRLRGPRWIFLAEAALESGETYCQIFDITDLKRRELSRTSATRLSQISQALGSLCDQLHLGQIGVDRPGVDDKVVALHGVDEDALADLLPAKGQGKIRVLANKLQTIAQRQRLQPEMIDLSTVVREAVQDDDQDIEVVGAAGLWPVLADPVRLQMALKELIANAKEAIGRGGRLQIELANLRLDRKFVAARSGLAPGEYVRICLKDDGPGMPADLVERAFNPFFTSKGDDHHLGLGLSLVYGFMNQSGGFVEVRDSNSVGTTVDLYFPRPQSQSDLDNLSEQESQP